MKWNAVPGAEKYIILIKKLINGLTCAKQTERIVAGNFNTTTVIR